jgi:hypothetical protein
LVALIIHLVALIIHLLALKKICLQVGTLYPRLQNQRSILQAEQQRVQENKKSMKGL